MSEREGKLQVRVASPYQTFFEGSAVSVSAKNASGTFDVLYDHANFFSILRAGRVTVNTGFDVIRIDIDSGVLKVSDNTVKLFANV